MVLDRQALGDDMPEFVRNRVGMQGEHLRTIRDKFGDGVRAVVPLFDQEVRGTAMLAQAAGALFADPAESPRAPAGEEVAASS